MRVRLTSQAQKDAAAAMLWWRRNREKAPGLLREELAQARAQLAAAPLTGVAVHDDVISTLRRLQLPKTRYLIFYRVHEAAGEVQILRIWHASRGQSPAGL